MRIDKTSENTFFFVVSIISLNLVGLQVETSPNLPFSLLLDFFKMLWIIEFLLLLVFLMGFLFWFFTKCESENSSEPQHKVVKKVHTTPAEIYVPPLFIPLLEPPKPKRIPPKPAPLTPDELMRKAIKQITGRSIE